MAQQDLAGLLTGITQAPIDPMAGQSMAQRQLSFGAQAAQGLRQGMGGLFGADTRTTTEKADQMLASLDVNDVNDQEKILQIVSNVNPQAAPLLKAQFAENNKQQTAKVSQRNALLKMARAQGNESMATWLEADGDLKTAASVLLKEPKLATAESYATMYDEDGNLLKTAVIGGKLHRASEAGWTAVKDADKLSATDPGKKGKPGKVSLGVKEREETYNAIISTNPDIAKVFTDEGYFWDDIDKNAKTLLLNKAEEIYAADPTLGRENALLQAAEVAPPTTGQPAPTADSFVGKKIKSLKPQ